MISFPAPALCRGSDEDLLVAIGDVAKPGFVKRHPMENGLRLWVEGVVQEHALGKEPPRVEAGPG